MTRRQVLRCVLTATLCSTGAAAQCLQPNFGTLVGTGDDTLFAALPLPFAFPLGGVNYDSIRIQTNGVVFLTQGLGAGSDTTSTGYSSSASTMVANLRGAAISSPRLAAYWRDLDIRSSNGAGIYLDTSSPGVATVTWDKAVHFGTSSPSFTFQLRLYGSGNIQMFYDGRIQNVRTTPIVGVSAGNAPVDQGGSDLSLPATGASTSPLVYQTFPVWNTFDLSGTQVAFLPNAAGGFDHAVTACPPAAHTEYGTACGGASGTVYELFAPAAFDLAGAQIRLQPNSLGGYTAVPLTGAKFVHTAPGLGLGDDQCAVVALPSPFQYPGGVTSSISVCSNGYIWMDSVNGLADFTPSALEVFSSPARLMPMWCDGVGDGSTNIQNVFAQHDPVRNVFYVTWNGLPVYGTAGGRLDVQVGLNLATMAIDLRYGTSASSGGPALVGWSPGQGVSSVDRGSIDLSGLAGFWTSATEAQNLRLTATTAPVLGSSVVYTTTGIPTGSLISFTMFSLGALNPGIALPGVAECLQSIDLATTSAVGRLGSPTVTYALAVPTSPAFAGISLFVQAAALAPSANSLGVITSNGLHTLLNNF